MLGELGLSSALEARCPQQWSVSAGISERLARATAPGCNAKSALTQRANGWPPENARQPEVRASRQKQNDRLCGQRINGGCGRASPRDKAQPECEALPTSAWDGETGASTATGDAASAFRWLEQNSTYLAISRTSSPALYRHKRPGGSMKLPVLSAQLLEHFREYFAPGNSTMAC